MRGLGRFVIATGAAALVLVGGASSQSAQVAPQLLTPNGGATFQAGTNMVFRIRAEATSANGSLWLYVSRSPTVVNACGTIGRDVEIEPFVRTSDPAVFEARPTYFSHSTFWMNTSGTYYWQAYQIWYQGGADGCLESEVRSFRIVAKQTAAPKQTPARPALPLSKARLQGNYDVVSRITGASGIDVKVGSKDSGVWGVRPYCGSGACDVRLTFSYRGASFDKHRLTLRLARSGAVYKGTGTAKFLECFFEDVPGPITVQVRVTKAAWIGGVWRATRITGSYVHTTSTATSGIYRCPAARVTAVLTGSRST